LPLDAFGRSPTTRADPRRWRICPEDVRTSPTLLERGRHTTKAVTKDTRSLGGALTLVLFNAFEDELSAKGKHAGTSRRQSGRAERVADRGSDGYLFASLAMAAAAAPRAPSSRGAPAVPRAAGEIMAVPSCRVRTAVALVTLAAQREMILPSLIPIGSR